MIEYLKRAKNPAVLFSGGADSLLVLHIVRQYKDVPVITFRHNFTDKQWSAVDRVIKEWNLEVWSVPPRLSYIVPNGEGLARVDEYMLGKTTLPVLQEFTHAEKCGLQLDNKTLDLALTDWDVIFTGGKKTDGNAAMGHPFNAPVIECDGVTLVQPLFNWTPAEVLAKVRELGLPYAKEWYDGGNDEFETGMLHACSRCLTDAERVFCPLENTVIPTVKWDRAGMLDSFRNKFGFEGNSYA